MRTEQENTDTNSITTSNQSFVNNAPFMMMRINTEPLVEKIQLFLSSQRIEMHQDKETGEWVEERKQIGLPLANVEGIMRLCNIVEMRINHHTAQGNFKVEHYWDFISRARKEITEHVIKKCYDWEILDSNLNLVIDEICALIECFLTRPIDNKEREGYANAIQSRENTVLQQPRNSFNMMGGIGRS